MRFTKTVILISMFLTIALAQPPALTSTILSNSVQDGTRKLRWSHTDHLGREHINSTTLNLAANVRDYLDASEVSVLQRLIDREAAEVLEIIESGGPTPTLDFAEWSDVRALSDIRKADIDAEVSDLNARKTRLVNDGNL